MLIRPDTAMARLGTARTQFYEAVRNGLMVRPIKVGSRATAFPDHELNTIERARIAGLSDAELRRVVDDLHAQRRAVMAEFLQPVFAAAQSTGVENQR